jgi:hypothetical protein
LQENRHTFTPESLHNCSRFYCIIVPIFTALHFPEITVFLFPVYTLFSLYGFLILKSELIITIISEKPPSGSGLLQKFPAAAARRRFFEFF